MSKKYHTTLISLLIVAVICLFFLDIILGSVTIPMRHIINILFSRTDNKGWEYIIMQLRLPRALVALFAGAGLSVAGLMMQTLFRNPLAGPYVLGISSGAGLGVAIYTMLSGIIGTGAGFIISKLNYLGQVTSAIFGAVVILIIVISIVPKVKDSVSLLIVGIMFGSLATAVISVLQFFSTPQLVQKFALWTMGSLGDVNWDQHMILSIIVITGFAVAIFLIKPMNALLLGESNAVTTGIEIKKTRYLIIISSSLIAGGLTAFTGPVAFIGIAIPHIVRMLFNSSNHKITIPMSAICGAALLLICDIISQVPGRSIVLPINVLTALFGAPVVIWIIIGKKNLRTSF
ncbi:MAG: iron ABC transporter permease [Bacteroidales bacterium]|nr:iron ABC transporter permease [Bacteroidales bacterium]